MLSLVLVSVGGVLQVNGCSPRIQEQPLGRGARVFNLLWLVPPWTSTSAAWALAFQNLQELGDQPSLYRYADMHTLTHTHRLPVAAQQTTPKLSELK